MKEIIKNKKDTEDIDKVTETVILRILSGARYDDLEPDHVTKCDYVEGW